MSHNLNNHDSLAHHSTVLIPQSLLLLLRPLLLLLRPLLLINKPLLHFEKSFLYFRLPYSQSYSSYMIPVLPPVSYTHPTVTIPARPNDYLTQLCIFVHSCACLILEFTSNRHIYPIPTAARQYCSCIARVGKITKMKQNGLQIN